MTPGQLALVGFLVDLGADPGHGLLNLDAGRGDIGDQGAGERAVGAFLAVKRGLPGTGREGDQRTLAGLHFGETCLYRHAAGCGVRLDLRGERIVAAGIEEYQLDLGVAHGLVEREIDVDGGAEFHIHFRFDVGVDRQQVVGARDGDAVAGIEEHRDVGVLCLLAEVKQPFRHLVAREVGPFNHLETDIAQRACHRPGVDWGVGKGRHVPVGAVADHEGDAAVGLGGSSGKCHAEKANDQGEVAHWKYPQGIEMLGFYGRGKLRKNHTWHQKNSRVCPDFGDSHCPRLTL